jgi:hypothetical protein
VVDARRQLTAAELPAKLERLGFQPADLTDALDAARAVVTAGDSGVVQDLAERLLLGIGDLDGRNSINPWSDLAERQHPYGQGVLPLLALVVTTDQVIDYAVTRGIATEIGWASLADLGQQVSVHRRTYGGFGLHTQDWLRLVWSGAFYWLGRLQFNLQPSQADWVLSTHIPETGPLTSQAVDASFAWARRFFGQHFPEHPAKEFHCGSWLLDPNLIEALSPESNIARFGRRWQLYGEPIPGDDDALFFTFHRRGKVDLEALPRETSLQRVVGDRLRSGGHWDVWCGRCDLGDP